MSRIIDCDNDPDYNNAYELAERAFLNHVDGRRGQAVLKEMEISLLALPNKRLIYSKFCDGTDVCNLAALALKREMDKGKTRDEALKFLKEIEEKWIEEDIDFGSHGESITEAAKLLQILPSMAFHAIYANDEDAGSQVTPEERYTICLKWVQDQIHPPGWTKPEKPKKAPKEPPPKEEPGQGNLGFPEGKK